MQTGLRGRDLISLDEWTLEEIETVLEVAAQLKRERALGIPHPLLRDRVLAMLFFFASTRTRASFEAGMAQLGGHAQFIESRTTQISHGDTAREIGEILGRYNDGIAIRNVDWGIGNRYIREVAEASRDYDLLRITGPVPDELLQQVAVMTAVMPRSGCCSSSDTTSP